MVQKKQKVSLIWYILPFIEIVCFFIPVEWVGAIGSMLLSLVVFAAAIASVVGFFKIRKQSMAIALTNLIVGSIILIILILSFLVGFFMGFTATT